MLTLSSSAINAKSILVRLQPSSPTPLLVVAYDDKTVDVLQFQGVKFRKAILFDSLLFATRDYVINTIEGALFNNGWTKRLSSKYVIRNMLTAEHFVYIPKALAALDPLDANLNVVTVSDEIINVAYQANFN